MIKVNGKSVDISNVSVSEYIETTDYNVKRIAIEKNGEILPKSQYDTTILQDGDELEIVSFVGGG